MQVLSIVLSLRAQPRSRPQLKRLGFGGRKMATDPVEAAIAEGP